MFSISFLKGVGAWGRSKGVKGPVLLDPMGHGSGQLLSGGFSRRELSDRPVNEDPESPPRLC